MANIDDNVKPRRRKEAAEYSENQYLAEIKRISADFRRRGAPISSNQTVGNALPLKPNRFVVALALELVD